ncbi:hypothetical protein [Halalkalirubrum salinum]|uniref:hypothetical protein n=1 Tax=Halalkalirubrum salinum TaxID=2563889 RepID=UPI0010FB37FF|nr:hypothetical protein [Halalkalirubrum salinum]
MRVDEVYFGVLGVAVGLMGLLAVVRGLGLALPNPISTLGVLTISGTFLLWRGVILLSASAFYLQGVVEGLDRRNAQGTVFLGSLMLWIVAGTDLLARLLETIPGGSEQWLASSGEILAVLGPPFSPSVVAAPFALSALAYWSQENEQ